MIFFRYCLVLLFVFNAQFDSVFPYAAVWNKLARNINVGKNARTDLFVQDCQRYAHQNQLIPVHQKNDRIVRIATYNVHFWTDPYQRANFNNILQVIRTINPDVLVLQEVNWGVTQYNVHSKRALSQLFRNNGYKYIFFLKAAQFYGAPFGNLVLSKYPFLKLPSATVFRTNASSQYTEKRVLINARIKLPQGKIVSLYGTHLDVFDQTGGVRAAQTREILSKVARDSEKNIFILGDFNEVRIQDYNYDVNGRLVWNVLVADNRRRNNVTSTNVSSLFSNAGFVDCFSYISQQQPCFSVWNGTIIDFIWLSRTWRLPVVGAYAYYDASSDHIPLVMDIRVDA